MCLIYPLLFLLTVHQVVSDTCSFTVTDRFGTLQSAPSSCDSIVYYFQNPNRVSYWSLDFTYLVGSNDVFTFFDGDDLFSPVILQSNANVLKTGQPYMSTGSWMTMQVTRISLDSSSSSDWSLQYINYEENPEVVDSTGYGVVGAESVDLTFSQSFNGVAEDFIGSTWVITPDPETDYTKFGLSVAFHLKAMQDTTGTLRVIAQFNGITLEIYGSGNVGSENEIFYYPDSAYDSKIIIRSQVRTQPGSYSSFKFETGADQWWSGSNSYSSSSGHPAIRLTIIGVLLGFGLVVGAIIAIVWCARRCKNQTAQYTKVDMMAVPPAKNPFQPQPMYVMMAPSQQQYAVPVPLNQIHV